MIGALTVRPGTHFTQFLSAGTEGCSARSMLWRKAIPVKLEILGHAARAEVLSGPLLFKFQWVTGSGCSELTETGNARPEPRNKEPGAALKKVLKEKDREGDWEYSPPGLGRDTEPTAAKQADQNSPLG